MYLFGYLISLIFGVIEILLVWLINVVMLLVKVLIGIFFIIFLINVRNGYLEASKREDYEEWFRSLKVEHQLVLASLAPEHKGILARQTPRFREWFLALTPEQRNDYLLRQKI